MNKRIFLSSFVIVGMAMCISVKAQEVTSTEESAFLNPSINEKVLETTSKGMDIESQAEVSSKEENLTATSEEAARVMEGIKNDSEAEALVSEDSDITAEDLGTSEPTILPTSNWYFAKSLWRGIKTITTFNAVKRAELKLKIANEKLLEARKVSGTTKDKEIIGNALENYQEEIDKVKEKIDKIKEKASDNPDVDKFLDKLADHELKQAKLLDKLGEKLPPEAFIKLQDAKARVIENLGNALNKLENKKGKISERIGKIMENQKGSEFKNFKNIEILKELKEKIPEEAKEEMQKAKEEKIEQLKVKLHNLKGNGKELEKFKKYVGAISGNEARHLEILNDLKQNESVDESLVNVIEEAKEKSMIRLQNKSENKAGLANPASVFCEENGGKIRMENSAAGIRGICVFSDGEECNEWAFFRGECGKDGNKEQIKEEVKKEIENDRKACIQVIAPAKNIKTGECKNFPTPCDVPAGWSKVKACEEKDDVKNKETILYKAPAEIKNPEVNRNIFKKQGNAPTQKANINLPKNNVPKVMPLKSPNR